VVLVRLQQMRLIRNLANSKFSNQPVTFESNRNRPIQNRILKLCRSYDRVSEWVELNVQLNTSGSDETNKQCWAAAEMTMFPVSS